MAEIARDAILYGGKDVAKAQKAAEDLLQKLVANGCDEAKAAPLSRTPRRSPALGAGVLPPALGPLPAPAS